MVNNVESSFYWGKDEEVRDQKPQESRPWMGRIYTYASKAASKTLENLGHFGRYVAVEYKRLRYGLPSFKRPNFVPEVISNEAIENVIRQATRQKNTAVIELFANCSQPFALGAMDPSKFDPSEDWFTSHGMPVQVKENLELARFVLDSKLHFQQDFYKTPMVYDTDTKQVMIKVEKEYISAETFLKRFELVERAAQEMPFLPPLIRERSTAKFYQNFEDGLIPYDQVSDVRPVKLVEPSGPKVQFCFRIEGGTDSPEDVKRLDIHSWVRLENSDGEVYSFGVYGQGKAISPDPFEYAPKNIKTITVPLGENGFEELLDLCKGYQSKEPGSYHLTASNCADLPDAICRYLNLPISSEDSLGSYDNLINRVKMSVVAGDLAKLLTSKPCHQAAMAASKVLEALRPLELQEHPGGLPGFIGGLVEGYVNTVQRVTGFSFFQALNARGIGRLANRVATQVVGQEGAHISTQALRKEALRAFRVGLDLTLSGPRGQLIGNLILLALEKLDDSDLKTVFENLREGDPQEMHEQFYDLFTRFLEQHGDYRIQNPVSLYNRLVDWHQAGVNKVLKVLSCEQYL